MEQEAIESSGGQPLPSPAPVLSYQSATMRPGKMVTVGRFPTSIEAAMHSARLTDEGIINQILNENVNGLGPYGGFTSADVQVHEDDAEAAKLILEATQDDLEPVEEPHDLPPILDDDGKPRDLTPAGAFEHIREMREAQAVLASANIRAFPPRLISRGEKPRGQGKRFILRVMEDDLDRARGLLADAKAEADDADEPRCPKCRSWRIHPVSQFTKSALAMFGIGKWPAPEMECLACHYRAEPTEFGGRV